MHINLVDFVCMCVCVCVSVCLSVCVDVCVVFQFIYKIKIYSPKYLINSVLCLVDQLC